MKASAKQITDEVQNYLKEWEDIANSEPDKVYVPQQKILEELFGKYPKNTDEREVLMKCCALNALYGTNIERSINRGNESAKYSLNTVAQHIVHNVDRIDDRLGNADLDVVGEIAAVKASDGNSLNITFYSFATKYCSFSNPDKYPIYDSNVAKALCIIQGCKPNSLKNYRTFYGELMELKKHYELENLSWIELDHYLFLKGRKL